MKKLMLVVLLAIATGCSFNYQGTDKERGYTGAIQTSTGVKAEVPHYE
jgi:hypothetical protein